MENGRRVVDEAGVGHMKGEKASQLKTTKQISTFPDTSKVIGSNANFRIKLGIRFFALRHELESRAHQNA